VNPLITATLPVEQDLMQAKKSMAKFRQQFFGLLSLDNIRIGHKNVL
jgi:hypothetical protein